MRGLELSAAFWIDTSSSGPVAAAELCNVWIVRSVVHHLVKPSSANDMTVHWDARYLVIRMFS